MMDTDKAYLLGIIIGGGLWRKAKDTFIIRLPYKKWGSIKQNPDRAVEIQKDIMEFFSPAFKVTYGDNFAIDYGVSSRETEWIITIRGDLTGVRNDLIRYGIEPAGELREKFNIREIVPALVDENLKRRFIAGIADTIGSTNKNHRRFNEERQIVSFELKSFNFSAICDFCCLLRSVGYFTDQILWNHPNFHAGNNPYYKNWKKGNKVRVPLEQFVDFDGFGFRSRAKSAQENVKKQRQRHQAISCPDCKISVSPGSVHPAEHDEILPESVRGGHYLHNRHVCAVLGCENAPISKIRDYLEKSGKYINPFPILFKDNKIKIENIIANDPLMAKREYSFNEVLITELFNKFKNNRHKLLYSTSERVGYPINEVMQAIAYLIADKNELNGNRVLKSYESVIQKHIKGDNNLKISIYRPDLLTPLALFKNDRGALIGAHNPKIYAKLFSFSGEKQLKLHVRPITEDDLRNAERN